MKEIATVISNRNRQVTPLETIAAVKAAGFGNVFIQWYNEDWPVSQEEQLKCIQALGLNVIFAHLGYYKQVNCIWDDTKEGDILIDKYRTDLDTCAKNGIPMVILHPVHKAPALPPCESGLYRLQRLTAHAKELNIKIALENTFLEGYLEYILANLKDENLGLCFDSGHYHAYFDDRFDLNFCSNRIFAVHLHDNDGVGDQHLLPFDGTTEWEPLVRNLKLGGFDSHIALEPSYRKKYLELGLTEFYKKAYERGEKLAELFEKAII